MGPLEPELDPVPAKKICRSRPKNDQGSFEDKGFQSYALESKISPRIAKYLNPKAKNPDGFNSLKTKMEVENHMASASHRTSYSQLQYSKFLTVIVNPQWALLC